MAIPREHLSDASSAKKFGNLCEWASEVQQGLYPGMHVNFQVNQGKHAGQTVGHLHLHIVEVPRVSQSIVSLDCCAIIETHLGFLSHDTEFSVRHH
jgi:diadenosine tetraphosphate (Ap4A) HIT family hydrolase